jgi:peptide deformylase
VGEVEGQVRSEELDGELEARRRAALAQIRQYPDPALRLRANDVEDVGDAVAELVLRMTRLMQEARGVGLAAPQVGVLRRVLVYQTSDDEPIVALVNPRLTSSSEETETVDEGCLSLGAASVIVPVPRPLSVTVEALTPDGAQVTVEAEGLEARVIQHELDHLDGVLIIDRTGPDERRQALADLRPQPILGPLV